MVVDDYLIDDFLFSVNDMDFYMLARSIKENGKKVKLKLSKQQFISWCQRLEDDEQAWELSTYQRFYNIL